jgi:hypothetical protein
MVNKSLVALVIASHDIEVGKILPPTYFLSKGLGEEGIQLEKKGFIGMVTKEKERSYAITSTGKEIISELGEYYDIILVEHS